MVCESEEERDRETALEEVLGGVTGWVFGETDSDPGQVELHFWSEVFRACDPARAQAGSALHWVLVAARYNRERAIRGELRRGQTRV